MTLSESSFMNGIEHNASIDEVNGAKKRNDAKLFAIARRDMKHPDGSDLADEQIREIIGFMRKMADIAVRKFFREQEFKKKLEAAGGGFPNEETGRNCLVCGTEAFGDNSWIDKYGLKCTDCQEAIDKKIVPIFIIGNKDSYYTGKELRKTLRVSNGILQSWIAAGIIKERVIPKKDRRDAHLQLFLLKDNKAFLPPKDMLEDRWASETDKKGKEHYKAYPWYYWVNPKTYLAGYGISQYMAEQDKQPDPS